MNQTSNQSAVAYNASADHQFKTKLFRRWPALRRCVSALCGSSIILASPALPAATIIKSDTPTMSAAGDWGGTAPARGFTGQFDNTISAANEANLTLGGPVTLDGLKFMGNLNGPVIINDTSILTLTNIGFDLSVANQDVTVNCPVYDNPNSATFINVAAGRTLTLGGGSTTLFNGTAAGLGTLLLSNATTPVTFTSTGSGQVFNMGNPVTLTGGLIIGTNATLTTAASFQSGRSGGGLVEVNGGTLSFTGGYLIAGRGGLPYFGRVVVQSGTVLFGSTVDVLIGFQGAPGEVDLNGGAMLGGSSSYVAINNGASASTATNASFIISGGIAQFPTINLGGGFSVSTAGTGKLTVCGGSLYVGAGGIILSGTGTFSQSTTLSGGTLGAFANWSSLLPMTLTNDTGNITFNTADTNGNPFNITLSGSLTGPGGFNKIGGGTLALSGYNPYSGNTIVSNGTLSIATTPAPYTNGNLTVDASSGSPTLSLQVANAGQYLCITNLTFANPGGVMVFDVNYGSVQPSGSKAPLQAAGDVSFASTPNMTIEGSAIPVGTFPLVKYTGALSGTLPSSLAINLQNGSASGYVTNLATTKTIALVVTSSTYSSALFWGVGNGRWDINSSPNWKLNSVTTTYTDGSAVQFDDSATGPSPITVTLNTTVSPSSITAAEAAKQYIIAGSGSIAGSATTLTQSGIGALTLASTNTYAGGTILNAGQLNINYGGDGVANSAIGAGPLTINGGTLGNTSGTNITLITQISQNWNANFTYGGCTNNLNLGAGLVILGANLLVNVASNGLESDGPISDYGNNYSLTKVGGGALTLAGPSSYGGGTVLNAGQININYGGDGGADGPLGLGTFTANGGIAIDNTSGGDVALQFAIPMYWNDSMTFVGSGNLDLGAGTLTLSGSAPFALTILSNTLTSSGSVHSTGTGAVIKYGNGAWTIGGIANNTLFNLTVNAGVVNLNKQAPYGCFSASASPFLQVNTNGAAFCTDFGANPNEFQNGCALRIVGGLFDLFGSSQSISTVTMNGGTLANGNATNTTSVLTSTNLAGIAISSTNCVFSVANGSVLALDPNSSPATFISGSGTLVKAGSGQLALSGNNTYSGKTLVNNGTLALTDPNSTGGGTISNSAVIQISDGATLDAGALALQSFILNGGQTLQGSGSLNGNLNALAGSVVIPGPAGAVGTLTVTNNIALAGQLLINLNRTNAQNCGRLVSVSGSIAYGGTLAATNVGPALQVGDVFHLFPSAVAAFSGVNLATTDAAGYVYTWNNHVSLDGSISVASVTSPINPNPGTIQFSLSGSSLTLSWPTNAGWLLQSQTNALTGGLGSNWVTLPGSAYLTSTNITINPANGSVFYRMMHP